MGNSAIEIPLVTIGVILGVENENNVWNIGSGVENYHLKIALEYCCAGGFKFGE